MPNGCWIVLGEGYDTEWQATLDGDALGPPISVDGGFNGWLLPPSSEPRTIAFRWTAQTPVTIGLFVSGLAALVCLLIASVGAAGRRTPAGPDGTYLGHAVDARDGRRRSPSSWPVRC